MSGVLWLTRWLSTHYFLTHLPGGRVGTYLEGRIRCSRMLVGSTCTRLSVARNWIASEGLRLSLLEVTMCRRVFSMLLLLGDVMYRRSCARIVTNSSIVLMKEAPALRADTLCINEFSLNEWCGKIPRTAKETSGGDNQSKLPARRTRRCGVVHASVCRYSDRHLQFSRLSDIAPPSLQQNPQLLTQLLISETHSNSAKMRGEVCRQNSFGRVLIAYNPTN